MLLINAWGNAPTHELTIVTEDYKYIHWPYAHELEPKEELYHLTADRYEMNNLVAHTDHRAALEKMQQHYDQALVTWKNECVQEGGYPLFAKIYDRHLSWDEKLAAMDNRMRRKYLQWRTENKKTADDKLKKEKKSKGERKSKNKRDKKGEKE